ncbi:PaaI family thioesterase [Streptomyces sp. NPDC001435]|uniref:PaaI family thioesterase n=1 Tax=Streptomyces sp. NPDC001435 TaxID=3364576 RepID=UPI0036751B9F
MCVMLLDELMGWARAAAGMPAMTISLDVNHHRPVPVLTPLRVVARVARTDGREIFVDGARSPRRRIPPPPRSPRAASS